MRHGSRCVPTVASRSTGPWCAARWRGPESNWRHHDFQSCALPTELPRRAAKASVRGVIRSIVAVGAAVLVVASLSGDSAQPPEPIPIGIPAPFRSLSWSPFAARHLRQARPLGPGAPAWARQLYRRSLRVLFALTDPWSGGMIAGDRPGWHYVWPRDAATGATALKQAGLLTPAFWGTGIPCRGAFESGA